MVTERTIKEIICILLCIMSLLPFLILFANATRSSEAIKAGVSLIPGGNLLENWANFKAKQNGMQLTVFRAMINSFTIAVPSTIFFMRQYMQSTFSKELVEAARIDGSGEFKTFNRIALPIMKPAIATQAIFCFVGSWNNLFMPSMILTTDAKKTLPLFVQMLRSDQFKTDYGVLYIGIAVTILPIFIVYFILSKHIVAGVALGGVKE
jgi:ABC-type glycerol-3-phosphate transport system permease component